MPSMLPVMTIAANAFPLWIVFGCLWAWFQPSAWSWFAPWIKPGLGIIMLGMGMTLRFSDFREALGQARMVAIGVGLQFLVMPCTAWAIATLFRLDPGLAIGLILVGCCPGGTASNVICYMARGSAPPQRAFDTLLDDGGHRRHTLLSRLLGEQPIRAPGQPTRRQPEEELIWEF